jgi:hypothetical protein
MWTEVGYVEVEVAGKAMKKSTRYSYHTQIEID